MSADPVLAMAAIVVAAVLAGGMFTTASNDREYRRSSDDVNRIHRIFIDPHTGCHYYQNRSDPNGPLFIRYGRDGKPMCRDTNNLG